LWPATETGFALAEGALQLDLPVGRKERGFGLSDQERHRRFVVASGRRKSFAVPPLLAAPRMQVAVGKYPSPLTSPLHWLGVTACRQSRPDAHLV
jgi:hypothetical protein